MIRPDKYFLSLLGLFAFSTAPAYAALDNQVPSCYNANKIPLSGPSYNKTFVVMIDQTVLLDQNLKSQALQQIGTMIQPGTHFVVSEFSAFSQGRYLNVLANGIAEPLLPDDQIGNVPLSSLPQFQRCMAEQLIYAQRLAEKAAYSSMQDSTSTLAQSDVLAAMKDMSLAVKADQSPDKVVLVISDGIENSTVADFYGYGTIRNIDPAAEMKRVMQSNMIGDFGGSKIYLLGGAMEPPAIAGTVAARDGYRNPQMLNHLEQFWSDYFRASNATLTEFGTPSLLVGISY